MRAPRKRSIRPSLATEHPVWGTDDDPCHMFDPIPAGHWFALRCHPAAEFVTAYLLRVRGVPAWAPAETRQVRANRYAKSTKRRIRTSALHGYVLVRLRRPELDGRRWEIATAMAAVIGVISAPMAGWLRPLALPDEKVERFHRRVRGLSERDLFELGAEVEVLTGPMADWPCRVVAIDGEVAELSGAMLGAERRIWMPLANVAARV